eukprot:9112293-Karenia_brevis.AAC.1
MLRPAKFTLANYGLYAIPIWPLRGGFWSTCVPGPILRHKASAVQRPRKSRSPSSPEAQKPRSSEATEAQKALKPQRSRH